jgi:hypothetical protein
MRKPWEIVTKIWRNAFGADGLEPTPLGFLKVGRYSIEFPPQLERIMVVLDEHNEPLPVTARRIVNQDKAGNKLGIPALHVCVDVARQAMADNDRSACLIVTRLE